MCVNICRRLFALYAWLFLYEGTKVRRYEGTILIYFVINIYLYSPAVLSPVRVRQSESLLEAHVSRVCIRGVRGAIGTAITSVVGYADPPGDGPPQITSVTLYDCLFDLWRVF